MHKSAPLARLVYVVGASGSGKDSLMCFARERLAGHPAVAFAHRYITRRADAGGENHVALSEQEFAARRRHGLFALNWESHGQAYGIGIEINQWLAKGVTVVVNGSRGHLAAARTRYPDMLPVLIEVSPAVLEARLRARARESAAAIAERLARHAQLQPALRDAGAMCATVRNDGALADSGKAFANLILACAGETACA